MNSLQRAVNILAYALLLAFGAVHNVGAESYFAKPIRLIVPYPPAGNPDFVARYVGIELGNALGQPVVVENRTGANGTIGGAIVAKAAADGYTLLLATDGPLAIPKLSELPYDPIADFLPIANIAATDFALLASPAISVKSVTDLVALLKSSPGKYNYASAGLGSPHHLAMELFKALSATDIVHVPYRGGSAVLPALVANEASLIFNGIGPALPFMKNGQLIALATTGDKRNSLAPDVPTMKEAGFSDFEVRVWFGVFAPARTPGDIASKLNAEIRKITAKASMREKLAAQGLDPMGGDLRECAEFFGKHRAGWQRIWEIPGVVQPRGKP
jgi:tripartite-type tricarboxylate transporter receptor subunit TctC